VHVITLRLLVRVALALGLMVWLAALLQGVSLADELAAILGSFFRS
jgi:hypothetical protein